MPFRILSIDGGGLRGIIPLLVLKEFEKQTGRPISDSFDLIVGTSTGGLIACALSVNDSNGRPLYDLEDIFTIYEAHGKTIFSKPVSKLRSFVSPKFTRNGLDHVLDLFFKNLRLSDCFKPLFITSYDVQTFEPFYFTSRFINPTSRDNDSGKNFLLADICRSTSAAPTFFSSFPLSFLAQSDQKVRNSNLIDGGIFVNNPSMIGYNEILTNLSDPLYLTTPNSPVDKNDIYVLSLGTGLTEKTITKKQGGKWGKIGWAQKLVDITMQASSQVVHEQAVSLLASSNYLRLNIMIERSIAEMDDSSTSTFQRIKGAYLEQIGNNQTKLDEISNFILTAKL